MAYKNLCHFFLTLHREKDNDECRQKDIKTEAVRRICLKKQLVYEIRKKGKKTIIEG